MADHDLGRRLPSSETRAASRVSGDSRRKAADFDPDGATLARGHLTPSALHRLQRTIGNVAVNQLLRVQRQVSFKQMTGGDPTPATSEQVANWLRQGSVSIPMYDIEYMAGDDDQHTFNWAYGQPEFVNHWRAMQQTRASKHAQWLTEEQNKLLQKIKRGERVAHGPFLAHEQTLPGPGGKPQGPGKVFEHYNLTDTNMLWRFTSRPSEYIWIAPHVAYEDIIGVTARHSGGNDKSNQDVKTLSFGRNIGALMGTAASQGGDKHVTNIIDKAAYLYGIDIGSLAAKGVSAHPATARAISLFESEYVLVSTPGNPPLTLDDLATARFENPFKGTQTAFVQEINPKGMGSLEKVVEEMGSVTPEVVNRVARMGPEQIKAILTQAKAAGKAANEYAFAVRDKESVEPPIKAILSYIDLIKDALAKAQV